MRIYTVHQRYETFDPDRGLVLVKEGFNWPALFFSVFWALWCRLWWVAAGLVVVNIVLSAALTLLGADPASEAAVSLGFAVLLGLLANDLKRWTLDRRGFRQIGVVAAQDIEAAERRFFDLNPQLVSELR